MSTTYEIPLSAQAQSFWVTLAGVLYRATLQFRNAAGSWFLDIADQHQVLLIGGIPLVTGVDLLAPYQYAGIGGQLFVSTDGNPSANPTYLNLGTTSHLYFVTTP